MLWAEASSGLPIRPSSGLRVERPPDAFPRAEAHSGTGPNTSRLQRRSRAGFSPASCPASRRTPEGSINDSSRTQTKMSILTGTPVPRRACSPSMQVGLRTAVQGCRAFSSVGSSLDPSNNGKRGVTPVNARLPRRGRPGFTPDSLFAGLGRLPNPATSTL